VGRIQLKDFDSQACCDMVPRKEQSPLMVYFTPICTCNWSTTYR